MTVATEIVMNISDLQYPFAHKDSLDFLTAVKEKYSPTRVICAGDEVDMHALSDYKHSPDGLSAGMELRLALKYMRKLYEVFPEVQSCISNHTARPFRRAFNCGIPKAYIRSYKEFLEAPDGWSWGDKFEIDGVCYEHGEGVSGKYAHLHAAERNMQSTVIGHLHTNAGVEYIANSQHLVFGMAVGCLIDDDAYAFAYSRTNRRKPILGCGIVDHAIPMFVPMLLKSGGRWVGRL